MSGEGGVLRVAGEKPPLEEGGFGALPGLEPLGAVPVEILASRLCTLFCRSTSCWFNLPRRDLISSRLSESPWTCVDMVSRRAPELAWTSWTDFWSEPMVAASLLTLSLDWPTRVLMTASCWVSLS